MSGDKEKDEQDTRPYASSPCMMHELEAHDEKQTEKGGQTPSDAASAAETSEGIGSIDTSD